VVNLFRIFFLSLVISSCIPAKKVAYLEGDGTKDTLTLKTSEWVYKVRVGDRFYIRVIDPLATISLSSGKESDQQNREIENQIQQIPSVRDYIVLEDGTLDIPVLGKIEAEGKTIQEITSAVYAACKGYISQPSIKLYMTNYNVTVLGEVKSPGLYQLITPRPDFFDAIAMANDMTDFANRKRVKLIRKMEGEVLITYLDITDPKFVTSPYFYIQPNDVIHIMPLNVKTYSNNNAAPLVLSVATTILTLIAIFR